MKTFSLHSMHNVLAVVIVGALFMAAYLANPDFLTAPRALSASTDNVSGWTWSENVGWMSFNNTSDGAAQGYGVNVDTSTKGTGGIGILSGSTWSEHVGWTSFDRSKTGNPPDVPFNGNTGPIAQVDWSTGNVTGWMRALSACDPTCTTNSGAGTNSGAWDGWIKLAGVVTIPGSITGYTYTVTRNDYPAGTWPTGITFDPVTNSIWVTNAADYTVSKINATTGATTAVYSVGSGRNPTDITFDPTTNSVWTANSVFDAVKNNWNVSKINVTNGARTVYSIYPPGIGPYGITFDPVTNSVWTANYNSNSISKFNIATGARTDFSIGNGPEGIVFDPITNSIWVTNNSTDNITKINVTNGTKIGDYPVGDGPQGIAFDSITNSMWIANTYSDNITKINVTNGTKIGDYPVGDGPQRIAFDPITKSIWVTNIFTNNVSKVDVTNGKTIGEYSVGISPIGIAFDPFTNSIWTANNSAKSVTKLSLSPIPTYSPTTTSPYGVKIIANKFSGWAWGSDVIGWVDFAPKIGGVSVGPVVGVPPCTASDPGISWGSCQSTASCPTGGTAGIRVGVCPTGGTVTETCTMATPLVCPSAPVVGGCGDGVCTAPETPLTCPKDCKLKYKQF